MAENNKEYYSDEKPRMTCSLQKGVYARTNAMYGPWESTAAFEEWFAGKTPFDIPGSTEIGVINQTSGAVDTFIYNRTSDGTGYWTDSSGGLVLSETDGVANMLLLNTLLATGDVKLRKGTYLLKPGVIVNGVTFDLNGACLRSTDEKTATPLILMEGERPVVRNGELCGNFNTPVNKNVYEQESLIRLHLYGNALIEGMDLHNCWGYAIGKETVDINSGEGSSDSWDTEMSRVQIGLHSYESIKASLVTSLNEGLSSNTFEYLSDAFNIPKPKHGNSSYKYISVVGIGYNYIISQKDLVYYFYDSKGNEIGNVTEMPGIMADIPDGAVKVRIKFFRYDVEEHKETDHNLDIFKSVHVYFFKVKVNCLTVRDCCMHNNQSLGMIGMPFGITKVLDCRSYGHGKPWKNAPIRNTNTTGFIDIEDCPSPIFIMDGCTCEDEIRFAMVGAYKSTITNCYGNIGINRGWSANISNCVGRVSSGSDNTIINVSNCTFYQTGSCSKNWTGRNNTYIDCMPGDVDKERDFVIRRLQNSSVDTQLSVNGIVRGRIYCPQSMFSSVPGIRNIATKRGSNLDFVWALARVPNSSDADYQDNVSKKGAVPVDGDCYGITSTVPFWPNGHTIHESTFTPSASWGVTYLYGNDNSWTGEYVDCTFNLDSGSMFNAEVTYQGWSKRLEADNATLIFRDCVINNADNYLFNVNMTNLAGKTYKVKFINCTIADESKLFRIEPTDFTYEIVTEDTDYDARINALLARIEALEGNG